MKKAGGTDIECLTGARTDIPSSHTKILHQSTSWSREQLACADCRTTLIKQGKYQMCTGNV